MHLRLISVTALSFPLFLGACSSNDEPATTPSGPQSFTPPNQSMLQPAPGQDPGGDPNLQAPAMPTPNTGEGPNGNLPLGQGEQPGGADTGMTPSEMTPPEVPEAMTPPEVPPVEQPPVATTPGLTGVEVPGADCTLPTLPEFAQLANNAAFPDPFTRLDGTPVTTKADWACRHRELRALFEKFETGPKTGKPAEVTGAMNGNTLNVNMRDANGRTATFGITITYPQGEGPFPVMIGLDGGSLNAARMRQQGVATASYTLATVRPENNRNNGVFTAFTGQTDSGSLIAWAWGVSRIIDALEATPAARIKADRVGITGCSRNGKGALMIGAMDSRIALTIPQESGSGGAAAWRAAELENTEAPQGCEMLNGNPTACVQKLSSTYTEQQWFGTAIAQFANAVNRLPVDHHELIALAAPRGLLALGNIGWRWLGRYGTIQGMSAAREVYTALGAQQNIGFVESGHVHCQQDYTGDEQAAIDAYVAKFLLDQNVSTDFWEAGVAFDAQRWKNWQTPTLQ